MDWWDNVGGMYQFFSDTPALAVDMALKGPQTDFGYTLAYGLQNTPVSLDVYPSDTQTYGG